MKLVHPLLALREVRGSYTGQAIAEVIEGIIVEYGMVDKWGVYMADNTDNCNTYCRALIERLRPGEPTDGRRSRYFSYIVNLATKSFIYGRDYETFIVEAEEVVVLSNRDQAAATREMNLWRKRGPFGKFHNVVKHIRASPQRRQRLERCVRAIADETGVGGDGGRDRISGQVQERGVGDKGNRGDNQGAVSLSMLGAVP